MRLEDFVKTLDSPSFVIDRLDSGSRQFEITAGRIQYAGGIVFVCKDLPVEQHRIMQAFDPGLDRRVV